MKLSRRINKERIVLFNLPTKHLKSDTEMMPCGILSVHSYLKKNGIDSILFDLAGTEDKGSIGNSWEMIPDSDIYGISSVTCQILYAQKLAKFLKERNKKCIVIMGGAHPTALPIDCLNSRNADIVIMGEGEKTLLELLRSSKEEISPIMFSKELEENIEAFFPLAFEDYGIYRYLRSNTYKYLDGQIEERQLNVLISRGCYNKCKYCMNSLKPNKIRYRNIENAVNELNEYQKRWNLTRVYFLDDELLTNKKILFELCDKMKETKLKWFCLGRTDQVTEEKLERMIDSNCIGMVCGVESFSNKVLKGIRKQTTAQQNMDALLLCAKHNLKVRAQMMVGCLPYEEWEDVQITSRYITDIIDATDGFVKFSFHIYQPLPGTIAYLDAQSDFANWDQRRLKEFDQFQTVGDFQNKRKNRPQIAHKNYNEIFRWYSHLINLVGDREVSYD